MKKMSLLLSVVLLSLLICPIAAQARASESISDYKVDVGEGDKRGEISIGFMVRATASFSKLGALKIEIYKANGDYVKTIWGNTSNGLLSPRSGRYYSNTYTYEGTPGVSYYAVVTICAGTATDYDTREITTSTERAPY